MGKAIMMMIFLWVVVTIGGGVAEGSVIFATTTLTVEVDDADTTITVTSTEGFAGSGFITILDERIGYASKTATTFKGNPASPLIRGAGDTTATAHSVGEEVRTIESSMLNQSMGYNLAVITDASGLMAFVTIPLALLRLLVSFFTLPLGFLGGDLQMLTYIWGVLTIGILLALGISLAGGRRMS